MSAAAVILPRIWATASAECEAVSLRTGKGSQRLLLVQAGEDWSADLTVEAGRTSPMTGPAPALDGRRRQLGLVPRQREPARVAPDRVAAEAAELMPEGERASIAFYRKYTEGLLTRYQKMSLEAGRVPGLLGREMFRGNVTNYKVHSFEDVVIFVHDMDRCLARLSRAQEHLIRRIGVQGYTQGETAALLGIPLRTVVRRFNEALDELTRMFLTRKMLRPLSVCSEGA